MHFQTCLTFGFRVCAPLFPFFQSSSFVCLSLGDPPANDGDSSCSLDDPAVTMTAEELDRHQVQNLTKVQYSLLQGQKSRVYGEARNEAGRQKQAERIAQWQQFIQRPAGRPMGTPLHMQQDRRSGGTRPGVGCPASHNLASQTTTPTTQHRNATVTAQQSTRAQPGPATHAAQAVAPQAVAGPPSAPDMLL